MNENKRRKNERKKLSKERVLNIAKEKRNKNEIKKEIRFVKNVGM